jgi:enterobacterial common antigen flippase
MSTNASSSISAPTLEPVSQAAQVVPEEKHTYGQILKSSALIGGSSVLNIVIGMVRTKVMAVLLGPAGVGLFGLYGSVVNLAQSVASMGVNSSGVRQIAEAVGSGNTERIARTATVLRRISILLGVLGAAPLILFSRRISTVTFGSTEHAAAISLLSAAVFFNLVSGGQGALIQGMRRISDLAKVAVWGALFGTVFTIPLVYFMRERGVVPSLVCAAAMTIITSWWYSRKVQIQIPSMTTSQVGREAVELLKLGFAFMASGLMMMGSAYAVRIIILHKLGFDATGLYQSSWTLGGLYVGFILQAMGADFYPRLTASSTDNIACNRMVNEQAQIGLLLGGPGVIATLTFAPLVIALFYTAKFGPAVELLRWIALGVTLRVINSPIGYIILAKGKQAFFFWSELAWTIVNVGLTWVCVSSFGLKGAGIAFFASYVFHGLLIYQIVHRLSGFRWSPANKQMVLLFFSLIGVVFCGFYVMPFVFAVSVGMLAILLSSAYSFRVLFQLIPVDSIPRPVLRALVRLGSISSRVARSGWYRQLGIEKLNS